MSKSCVNTKSREFKTLMESLHISSGDLELALHSLPDAGSNMTYDELVDYAKQYFKINTTVHYSKNDYKKAVKVWDALNEHSTLSRAQARILYNKAISIFGKENVVMFQDNIGDWVINISHPTLVESAEILNSSTPNTTSTQTSKLQEAVDLFNKVIEDSREHIVKEDSTHEYFIDGKKADMSVTQFIYRNKPEIPKSWGIPSSRIGNTVDRFARAYFSGEDVLNMNIPNLSKEDAENLKKDLDKLKRSLDSKFGEGQYRVITDEVPIAGVYRYIGKDGKSTSLTIAGTPDMIIIDKEGNFHIYDFKTKRINSNSSWDESKLRGYYEQLTMYKSILESNYPELKGRIKDMKLIRFNVAYPTPLEEGGEAEYDIAEPEDGVDIDTLYASTEDMEYYAPIEEFEGYSAPRLSVSGNEGLFDVDTVSLEGEFESLSQEDKDIISEEIGEIKKEPKIEQSNRDYQFNALYNPGILPASERLFLGNTAMSYTSYIISQLQSSPKASSRFFGNEFSKYDFTSMSREDIINIVGIGKILNYVKETYFNPENRILDIDDFSILKKLQVVYDNWGALTQSAYSKLILLEDTTVIATAPEDIKREDLDADMSDWAEGATLEEKEREYWQIGQRQISARASLSSEIRRAFERLPIVDNDGDNVADKYGYNFMTFVDSGEAINKILDWVQNCTSIVEMEEILRDKATVYPWLNSIVEKIQDEPFRSLFYQNFRKQFTKYSIVTVSRDKNGKRVYETTVINTKGASKTILDGIINSYNNGIMSNIIIPIKGSLDGKGRLNVAKVSSLSELTSKVYDRLKKAHSDKKLNQTLKKELPNIANILTSIGIPIDTSTLQEAFSKDSSRKNFVNTNASSVLTNLTYLFNTLQENKDNTEYNPVEKGGKGNIYSNYKNIVTVLAKYIQDSIESSTYENGKMHYSFVTPSYMGKLVDNLKDALGNPAKFQEFIQKEYGSYRFFYSDGEWKNVWLDKLANSEEARNHFDYKVQLSFDKTPYTDLSELGYTLSLMSEYFYDSTSTNRNQKLAWYRLPILANKPSSEFVRFTRYTGKNYKRYIKEGLRNVFDQELMRIQTVLERSVNPKVNKIGVKDKVTFDIKDSMLMTVKNGKAVKNNGLIKKIKNRSLTINDLVKGGKLIFAGSGAEFKFLSALNNDIITGTELGKMIVEKINGRDIDEEQFNIEFSKAIDAYMDAIVANEINTWESIGLFDTETTEKVDKKGKKEKVTTYKYVSQFGNSESELMSNLEEYVWNDMFATINIIQLTATDLAYYKNVEDFQKRYAQVHSPAMRLNVTARDSKGRLYSEDGIERTIYLKDSIKSSDIIPNIEKALDDRISELSGQEKAHMKMMKGLILSAFKKVNVADAQGYSSPTSYRKKMGMMGRWTTEMEEAYNRIKSGNYNVNDLGIVWQPLKPFVFSNIRKASGATAMSELRVPVQNKNSEYMLFLADAIMRGNKQNNKLLAIFDFMEDSAYSGRKSKEGKVLKEGTYNGKGIDTVQFESAVNSGSMGAIDLNKYDTYEDIKKALKDAVYYDSKGTYNDQYVHSIPFEDYGIQQEVPAHLVDRKQLMGSQVRILSISDITPGTKFKVGNDTEEMDDVQLRDEYQKLIAENIRDSFNKLIKDFKLKGTRREKNGALSKLLIESILKDQRYGADLLRACTLTDGEFTIPINDPIQSIRIQQLLNSIIKTRINKQETSGGPVVQASAFGLSEDLHIRFKDSKGNLLDTIEEFANKKHKTIEEVYEDYKKYVNKNQASIAYFECYMPIPSRQLEAALTKKDGSMMSIDEAIEKGIMTEEMRKAIGYRIPTEDKYSMAPLMIKGFLPKAAGEAIMLPKEITTLSGSDFDIDKMYVMLKSFYNDKATNWKLLEEDIMATDTKSKGEIKKKHRDAVKMAIDQIRNGNMSFNNDPFGQKVLKYFNEHLDRYTSTEGRDARNNRIFDIQWAVLTSADTMSKMFNPGSFDVQKKSARIISILKATDRYTYEELSNKNLNELDDIADSASNKNILLPTTQVYFHKQNMTSGKLIGVFANNNTSHAFLSMQNISLNLDNGGFMFDGYTVNNHSNNKLDSLYGKDGSLISKTIAGFLAASVDAVKDPVLNFMNLNTFTANTAMLLARLGFDSDSIGMFLTQPIIEKATREYFKRSNEGYTTVDEVIDDLLPDDSKLIESMQQSLETTPFSKEDLAQGIELGSSDTDFQISALLLFQKLSYISQDLNTLTFLTKFNSVTNAVGPTIADTLVMRERYEKFIDKMNDNPPFNEEALQVIENSPILDAFFSTTVADGGASELIFKEHFPHYSSSFTILLERLRQSIKGQLDSKLINKFVGDFIYYKLTLGNNPVIDGSKKARKRYINNFTKIFSEESTGIVDNDLLKIITLKSSDYKCPVPTLEAKTGGYSIDVQERVKSGWGDLILNPDTAKLGVDLFLYNIYRNGFGFSPKTFGHLASVDVRLNIPRYIESIRDTEFNDNFVNIDDFLYMFLRNHTNEYKLVPRLNENQKVKVSEEKTVNGEKIITFAFDKNKHGMESIIVSTSVSGTTFAPVIVYNDKVYMYPRYVEGINRVTYTETTPLGNTNNFLEYGPEGAFMESVINNSKTARTPIKEEPDKLPEKDVPSEPEYRKSFTKAELTKLLKTGDETWWRETLDQEDKELFSNIDTIINALVDRLNVDPEVHKKTVGRLTGEYVEGLPSIKKKTVERVKRVIDKLC